MIQNKNLPLDETVKQQKYAMYVNLRMGYVVFTSAFVSHFHSIVYL